jgi:hypothetical protein
MMENYSLHGWRVYNIKGFLKAIQKDGYKTIAKIEKNRGLEIIVEGDWIYIKDKFKKIYG